MSSCLYITYLTHYCSFVVLAATSSVCGLQHACCRIVRAILIVKTCLLVIVQALHPLTRCSPEGPWAPSLFACSSDNVAGGDWQQHSPTANIVQCVSPVSRMTAVCLNMVTACSSPCALPYFTSFVCSCGSCVPCCESCANPLRLTCG